MARIAKSTNANDVRWNRCKDDCGCAFIGHPDPRFCKCWATSKGKCGRDRRTNAQMRAYALGVAWTLNGSMRSEHTFMCPLTGQETLIADGQVDKVDPRLGYVPTNVIMVSIIGNQERANLQKGHHDIPQVSAYIADVISASANVYILPVSVAWKNVADYAGRQLPKGETTGADMNSRHILEGPYGM